jgi:hypothetical protein
MKRDINVTTTLRIVFGAGKRGTDDGDDDDRQLPNGSVRLLQLAAVVPARNTQSLALGEPCD